MIIMIILNAILVLLQLAPQLYHAGLLMPLMTDDYDHFYLGGPPDNKDIDDDDDPGFATAGSSVISCRFFFYH